MSKLKKYAIITLMIIVSGLSVLLPIYIWPKEVNTGFDGIMFRAGEPAYAESVAIRIEGHINNRLFGGKLFLGKILIDEMDIREDFKSQNIQIKFKSSGLGMLVYLDDANGDFLLIPEGYVAMDKDGSGLAISLLEGSDADSHDFNGSLMIAGPAADRSGALARVNNMMRNFLDEPLD